jgi:hypothetical protein
VPKTLTQYRVFIGSPGGLTEERNCFRAKLDKFTSTHSEPHGLVFYPVGWEETIGGVGRPQELINEDLKQCDYAVFVLHNRWGSSTGGTYTSGVEEELAIAERLYRENKIRNIALFFKAIDPVQLRDPGKQLESVLAFKKRIEEEKRYLFNQYGHVVQFREFLDAYLAKWMRDHLHTPSGLSTGSSGPAGSTKAGAREPDSAVKIILPSFDYWIAEAFRLLEVDDPDHHTALFCAKKATHLAQTDIEWARARNVAGIALSN